MTAHKPKKKKRLPLWAVWVMSVFVLLLVIGGTFFWIIQGSQAIVPVAVLTALGTLLAFAQVIPTLVSVARSEHSDPIHKPGPDPQTEQRKLPISSVTPVLTLSPLSQETPSDPVGSAHMGGLTQQLSNKQPGSQTQEQRSPIIAWRDAPHIRQFYGREMELKLLQQWITAERCHVIAVLGMGGIGKTSLSVALVEQIKASFASIFWCSLQNATPFLRVLQDCIQFFSRQQHVGLPQDEDEQIILLLEYFQKDRCLLILDSVEAVLQGGEHTGHYHKGNEAYGRLIQRIGQGKHQSCLLLTSREKPKEIAFLEGDTSPVRSYQLKGLDFNAARQVLEDKGLHGASQRWSDLIEHCTGNPLILKLVSQSIRELFQGDIPSFLRQDLPFFHDVRNILDEQFERLSGLEQEIMYWLSIEREAVPLETLLENVMNSIPRRNLQEALLSLLRRDLIETSTAGFLLQNVIMEYITDRFVIQVCQQIQQGNFEFFQRFPLMKARIKDYVRESQVRLLLKPVAQSLLSEMDRKQIERLCQERLSWLRTQSSSRQPDYTAGNILNLLIHLESNLVGYDFSHLDVRQAWLQNVSLSEVNFAYAHFSNSVFTDTFGGIHSVAFNQTGALIAAGTTNGDIRLWNVASGAPLRVFLGHTDWVRSVAFSPDGTLLSTASDDRTVRVWEVSTGACAAILLGHTHRVRCVAFHPDGNSIATASEDWTVRIWEIRTGACLTTLSGHTSPVWSVAFSPDGTLLGTASDDRTVRVWEVSTGACLVTLSGHTSPVWSVAFSPDNKRIVSGSEDKTVRLWDVSAGDCLHILQGHQNKIWSVAFNHQGMVVASGSEDQTIRVWDVTTGQCLTLLQGHTNGVWSVAFHPNDRFLASGSYDQTVKIWEVNTAQSLLTLQGHSDEIWSVDFHPTKPLLVSGSEDKAVRVWQATTGQCLYTLKGHMDRVLSVAFSSDGELIASSSLDQTIKVWQVSTGHCLQTLQGHAGPVRSFAFHPAGAILATGSEDQTVRIWHLSTGRCVHTLQGHTNRVLSVAFSLDGRMLASSSIDTTVRVWDSQTGQCLHVLQEHTRPARSVAFHPGSNFLATGSEDQTIRLWCVKDGQCFQLLQGHTNRVRSLIFSPDGNLLASRSDDLTIRVWDTTNWQCLQVLRGHQGWIYDITFSPDSQLLVSGSEDQTIRVWECTTGQCLRTLEGHTQRIWSVALSADGENIASGGHDGLVKVWNSHTGSLLQTLRGYRPYERMNITGVTGLTEAQKATLIILGAIDECQ